MSFQKVRRGISSVLLEKRTSKIGLAIILAFLVFVIVGPLVVPYPTHNLTNEYASPSLAHPLGTDQLGADILSELVWGAAPSMIVGVFGALGAVLIGLIVGVFAGYFLELEGVLTGMTDIVMIFPAIPLMVLLGTIRPASNIDLIVIISIVLWPPIARSIRSQVLSLREMPFIEVAKMSGMSDWEIIGKSIFRSVAGIAFAYFVLTVGASIIVVTGLEYLGVQNPDIVSWGSMIYWGQQFGFYSGAWAWVIAPGAAISLLTIGFAMIGFSFEEVLNPRLRTT